jgi:DNA-binding MarR family transcriptional regulator
VSGTPIKCGHCKGTGHTVLASTYEFTLKRLRRVGKSTGADLARLMECKPTAMNNRLRYLERLGFVREVERDGRKIWYEATQEPR